VLIPLIFYGNKHFLTVLGNYFKPNLKTVTKSYSLPAFSTLDGNSGLLQESG